MLYPITYSLDQFKIDFITKDFILSQLFVIIHTLYYKQHPDFKMILTL